VWWLSINAAADRLGLSAEGLRRVIANGGPVTGLCCDRITAKLYITVEGIELMKVLVRQARFTMAMREAIAA
jgi:hypothetical protein